MLHFGAFVIVVQNCCDNMSLKGEGAIYEHAKGRIVIYVPAKVRSDSAFPFEVGEKVNVRIDGKKLIVEKL